jgi:hypothetical protein
MTKDNRCYWYKMRKDEIISSVYCEIYLNRDFENLKRKSEHGNCDIGNSYLSEQV